jgi:hypothetical protein
VYIEGSGDGARVISEIVLRIIDGSALAELQSVSPAGATRFVIERSRAAKWFLVKLRR